MNEKAELFTKEKQEEYKEVLAGTGDKCPFCGKEYKALPPLVPNTQRREFYGGRIKFFKEVDCDCGARLNLLIERRYNSKLSSDELYVIDSIILKKGKTKEEVEAEKNDLVEKMVEERIHKEFENGRVPSMQEREAIRKETVLATIVDLDTKVEALCMMTRLELQALCQKNKVKFVERDSKEKIARRLLAVNPNLVSAD